MKITAIRHCKADGQESLAALTAEGKQQAKELATFLEGQLYDCVVSSPFKRAIDTIKPFAELSEQSIKIDERLAERILSAEADPNWRSNLERTYIDEHLKFPGGESTFEAKQRISSFINDLQTESYKSVLIVTHGNLLSLMINLFDPSFGFKEWELLSNPDVYLIDVSLKDVSKLWVS
ncbi:histidine phosphatase family protein [Fictibacillus norfolkensis]|uniref:Histidine phosphatase family protein n=1 Tax=Fictibacillus norfolkensis TaxID=2762233 RepID=A0ABR8SKH7_9BACL|nr:histidine phosphatase family protein [Fictibacillus norfolkensis]MBD7963844.1 histidine phosphatase family protein [Fictibacillus norfolkensis]